MMAYVPCASSGEIKNAMDEEEVEVPVGPEPMEIEGEGPGGALPPTLEAVFRELAEVTAEHNIPLLCVSARHGTMLCTIGRGSRASPVFWSLAQDLIMPLRSYTYSEQHDGSIDKERWKHWMRVANMENAWKTPRNDNLSPAAPLETYAVLSSVCAPNGRVHNSCPMDDGYLIVYTGPSGALVSHSGGHVYSPCFHLIDAICRDRLNVEASLRNVWTTYTDEFRERFDGNSTAIGAYWTVQREVSPDGMPDIEGLLGRSP